MHYTQSLHGEASGQTARVARFCKCTAPAERERAIKSYVDDEAMRKSFVLGIVAHISRMRGAKVYSRAMCV